VSPFDWLSRLESRASRRQASLLGASLLAALALPKPTDARPRKGKAKSARRGWRRCRGNKVFCSHCGGLCIPPDVDCSDALCTQPCNETTCGPGEYCCNASCSRCAKLGRGCTKELCPPKDTPCGKTVCGRGEYCCNASCSMCAPIGALCPAYVCPPDPVGEPCGKTVCGPKEYCCSPSCGICSPIGGACPAIACLPDPVGERCGKTTCPPGQHCCNASCGICTPPGAACIMIACNEPETDSGK
jgi:hypothetical protein